MDVEKRMNLSLDEIIKGSSKSSKAGTRGDRRKGSQLKSKAQKQIKGKSSPKDRSLTVKRTGLKKQSGKSGAANVVRKGNQVAVQVNRTTKAAPGKRQNTARKPNALPSRGRNITANKSAGGKTQRKQSQPQRNTSSKGPKRVVDFPQLADLRITIQNDRAFQQPQAQYIAAPAMVASYGPAVGYGPRNLPAPGQPQSYQQPRAAPQTGAGRRQRSSEYGVSQRVLGIQNTAARPLTDYDNPRAQQSYMRMDTR